jgi:uncharacterized protein (TIGR03435 family)
MQTLVLISTLCAGAAVLRAQATPGPSFEVAAIKLAEPQDDRTSGAADIRGGPGSPDPGQIRAFEVTVKQLLRTAYDVTAYRVVGPEWLDLERYTITAKVPPGASKDEVRAMWRNLLTERFGVVLHHESKEMAVEDLVIAKGGPKLAAADPNDPDAEPVDPLPSAEPVQCDKNGIPKLSGPGKSTMMGADRRVYVVFRAQPIYSLVRLLEWTLQKPVIDKTGLKGRFDYAIENLGTDTSALSQLGLKLISAREPLDMLVIDHAEKTPTEN